MRDEDCSILDCGPGRPRYWWPVARLFKCWQSVCWSRRRSFLEDFWRLDTLLLRTWIRYGKEDQGDGQSLRRLDWWPLNTGTASKFIWQDIYDQGLTNQYTCMTYNTPNDQANAKWQGNDQWSINDFWCFCFGPTVLLPYYTRCHQIIRGTPPINNQLSLFCIVCVCRQPPGTFTFTTLTFH